MSLILCPQPLRELQSRNLLSQLGVSMPAMSLGAALGLPGWEDALVPWEQTPAWLGAVQGPHQPGWEQCWRALETVISGHLKCFVKGGFYQDRQDWSLKGSLKGTWEEHRLCQMSRGGVCPSICPSDSGARRWVHPSTEPLGVFFFNLAVKKNLLVSVNTVCAGDRRLSHAWVRSRARVATEILSPHAKAAVYSG